MEFVLIPAGEFDMGKYEVTQKQWRDVMGTNPSEFKGDNLPVEQVSRDDAREFVGLYDVHGNVWEWVQDKWHDNHNGAPTDGSSWEEDGSSRVGHGGGWCDFARRCRSAFRDNGVAGFRDRILHFRLLRIL